MNEFEQTLESDLKRMYWDYNDGLYDSRELTGSYGMSVRGFSTALDGTYNLTGSGKTSR